MKMSPVQTALAVNNPMNRNTIYIKYNENGSRNSHNCEQTYFCTDELVPGKSVYKVEVMCSSLATLLLELIYHRLPHLDIQCITFLNIS